MKCLNRNSKYQIPIYMMIVFWNWEFVIYLMFAKIVFCLGFLVYVGRNYLLTTTCTWRQIVCEW